MKRVQCKCGTTFVADEEEKVCPACAGYRRALKGIADRSKPGSFDRPRPWRPGPDKEGEGAGAV